MPQTPEQRLASRYLAKKRKYEKAQTHLPQMHIGVFVAIVVTSILIGYFVGFYKFSCNHVNSESGQWVECQINSYN